MAQKLKVLVVDDVQDIAQMLAYVVRSKGHEATCVTDPREAALVAWAYQPDAVLLDIGMPHLNGYELAPRLREALAPRTVSIVAVTAWGSEQDRAHSKALGFDAHLVKPIDEAALFDVLDAAASRSPK